MLCVEQECDMLGWMPYVNKEKFASVLACISPGGAASHAHAYGTWFVQSKISPKQLWHVRNGVFVKAGLCFATGRPTIEGNPPMILHVQNAPT